MTDSKKQFAELMQTVKNTYTDEAGCPPPSAVYSLINRLRRTEKYVKDEDIAELVRYIAKTRNDAGLGARATIALRRIVANRCEKAMCDKRAQDELVMAGLLKELGI